jgi:hypothetical protein
LSPKHSEEEKRVQKFIRIFDDVPIRMIRMGEIIYFSAYDVVTALRVENKRRAVNLAVIKGHGSLLELVPWENENILMISDDFIISLIQEINWDLGKKFLRWTLEVDDVARSMQPSEYDQEISGYKEFYATTQIAKNFGLSASKLNDLLRQKWNTI